MKSETFDWEINDKIYNINSDSNQSDPCLGILGGIIHLLIRGYESPFGSPRTTSEFHTYYPKFYYIGRFNQEYLSKITLMEQSKTNNGGHRNMILIPGVSRCYLNLYEANQVLQSE